MRNEDNDDEKFDRFPEEYLVKIDQEDSNKEAQIRSQESRKDSSLISQPSDNQFQRYRYILNHIHTKLNLTENLSQTPNDFGLYSASDILNMMKNIKSQNMHLLKSNGFTIDQSRQQFKGQVSPQIQFKIINHLSSWEIIQIHCRLGVYSKTFVALNSSKHTPFYQLESSELKYLQNNGFNIIYNHQMDGQNYTLKLILKQSIYGRDNKPKFACFLKELFIAEMMSSLEIGPKIIKIHGFDFIICKNYYEFCMEQCKMSINKDSLQQLQFDLFKMHSFSICHLDIKDRNIAYSLAYRKHVFIDFGYSVFVSEKINQKTLTYYTGTFGYVSQDMSRLFNGSQRGLVNLYENDYFMLRTAFKNIQRKNTLHIQRNQFNQTQNNTIQSPSSEHLITKNFINTENIALNNETVIEQLIQRLQQKISTLQKCGIQRPSKRVYAQSMINLVFYIQRLKYMLYINLKTEKGLETKEKQRSIENCLAKASNIRHKMVNQFVSDVNQDVQCQLSNLAEFMQVIMGKVIEPQYYFKKGQQRLVSLNNNSQFLIDNYRQLNQIMDQAHIVRLNKLHDVKKESQRILPENIKIFCSKERSLQHFCNQNNARLYLQRIFPHLNLLKNQLMLTVAQKKLIAQVYHHVKSIIFAFVFNEDQLKSLNNSQDPTITRHIKDVEASFPEQNASHQEFSQIILFYKDLLTFTLVNNHNKLHSTGESVFDFCFINAFSILKNLIFLRFKYQIFIKHYLKNTFKYFITHREITPYFSLIMIKQSIQIGLIINHSLIPLTDEQRQNLSINDKLLEQDTFVIQNIEMDINEFSTPGKYIKFMSDIQTVKKMWIFYNPTLAKLKLSFQVLQNYFAQISQALDDEYESLSFQEKYEKVEAYNETKRIVKDFFLRYLLKDKKQRQVKRIRAIICYSYEKSYRRIFYEGKENEKLLYYSQVECMDYNLLILPECLQKQWKDEQNYEIYQRIMSKVLRQLPDPVDLHIRAKIVYLMHKKSDQAYDLVRQIYSSWRKYFHQIQKLITIAQSVCESLNACCLNESRQTSHFKIICFLLQSHIEIVGFYSQLLDQLQDQELNQVGYARTILIIVNLWRSFVQVRGCPQFSDLSQSSVVNMNSVRGGQEFVISEIDRIISKRQGIKNCKINFINQFALSKLKLIHSFQTNNQIHTHSISINPKTIHHLTNLSLSCLKLSIYYNQPTIQDSGHQIFWKQIITQSISLLSSSLIIPPNVQIDKYFLDLINVGGVDCQAFADQTDKVTQLNCDQTLIIEKHSPLYDMLYCFSKNIHFHILPFLNHNNFTQKGDNQSMENTITAQFFIQPSLLNKLMEKSQILQQFRLLQKANQNLLHPDIEYLIPRLYRNMRKVHQNLIFSDNQLRKLLNQMIEQYYLIKVNKSERKSLCLMRKMIKHMQVQSVFRRQPIKEFVGKFLQADQIDETSRLVFSKKIVQRNIVVKECSLNVCQMMINKRQKYLKNVLSLTLQSVQSRQAGSHYIPSNSTLLRQQDQHNINTLEQQKSTMILEIIMQNDHYEMVERKISNTRQKLFDPQILFLSRYQIKQRNQIAQSIKEQLTIMHDNLSQILRLKQLGL